MERKRFNSLVNGQEVATSQQFGSAVLLRINYCFYNAKIKFLEDFNQKFCHSQTRPPLTSCARETKVENLALPIWGWTLWHMLIQKMEGWLSFFSFGVKSKCISTSFVFNHMKILESGKYIPVAGDELNEFASSEAHGPRMKIWVLLWNLFTWN